MIDDQFASPSPRERMGGSGGDVTANLSNFRLMKIFDGSESGEPPAEIRRIFCALTDSSRSSFVDRLHRDITAIFHGHYANYRFCSGQYHNLRHTIGVALATVRLLHGLHYQSITLSPEILELVLICAYFHDTGMLLTDGDLEDDGAACLRCHEERSIANVSLYMADHAPRPSFHDDAAAIIESTNLTLDPRDLQFRSEEVRLAGQVLGTADILAQMADRYYLEALPNLYLEQLAAGIHQYPSAIDLMRQTTTFYHRFVSRRLRLILGDVCGAMRDHFHHWWSLDRNLYLDYIDRNIEYLEHILEIHDSGNGNLVDYLRRKQPPI